MPFHEGVYYPYSCDTQGAHSSAGIPSVLNSPAMTPSSGASAILPFKFRPRRESVDWRRINAVDIDSVVSQLDVDALQEHINTVTFCSLDGERCPRCQSPVDQTVVKLFQLAQLTVQWLLHCQEFLGINLRAAEERLAAADGERERLLAQQRKQEEKARAMGAELRQRKRIIRTQQSMLTPGIISSQKCQQCDKSFINAAFLQNHMQRRHPDDYELQLRSNGERKSEIDSLKVEIGNLREQIDRQQQELQAKTAQEKEQRSLHKDLLREMERFKAEEMTRVDRKIEDACRDSMRREFLYSRNIQALNEANLNQIAKDEKPFSPDHSQPERDVDNYKELEQQLKKQDKKWESRLRDMMSQHESEKNRLQDELSRLRSSVSDHQERSRSLQQEMERRLQEKERTVEDQREQIRNMSFNPPTRVVEVPVAVSAPAREPKAKRVALEEPLCALKLDPIEELSEEEKDSCSLSEKRPAEKKPKAAPETKPRATSSVLRNSNIKRDMRPDVEQTVTMKLERLGVKPDQSGLTKKRLDSILSGVHSRQNSFAKGKPEYWRQRKEILSTVEQRLESMRRGGDAAPETPAKSRRAVQVSQDRPRSCSLPSRATQVMSGPAVKQPKTPQPLPRTKTSSTQPKTSTPTGKSAARNFMPKTPPFSSDEDSERQPAMEEDRPRTHQRGPSPPSRQIQASLLTRDRKAAPGQDRQAPVTHSSSSWRQQAAAASAGGVTKTAVTKMESDEEEEDWSDLSELEEIRPNQLQSHKDQNGNVEKRHFGVENKINDLARKMEKQLLGRAVKKPAGGVSILPAQKDEVQELTYTDLEESSEYMVSSLEDREESSKPAQGSGPVTRSLDSASTSVWGSSTGKGPKTGLTEAGTGSTLKSSLCSLSDISDSEDISNKL